ncbi:COX15/CtaA family protein [Halomarina litorea]|uniref:COX15/CtaA family protein n=1 Tax=Halomarina litorea TaxID=2961595 RepID=UPI0020C51B25|nr:COX15/CtaA family protein [Halomarina sp. BCD28]
MESRFRFRTLAALSAALTFVLILLGVYTAAAGAGLTCEARWPLCDGAVFGLFPANWGSFIEWFHRLVAMVTGFVILGTTVAAFRRGRSRRVKGALAAATVILPAQIVLGALTVTEYEWLILTAHFVTATTIFTGVVLAALWSVDSAVDADRVRQATTVAVLVLPVVLAFTPRLFVIYSAGVQVGYYAAALTAYAALVAATVWARRVPGLGRIRPATLGGASLLFGLLVVGRQVYGETGQLLTVAATLLAFALAGAAAWVTRRRSARDRPRGVPGGD